MHGSNLIHSGHRCSLLQNFSWLCTVEENSAKFSYTRNQASSFQLMSKLSSKTHTTTKLKELPLLPPTTTSLFLARWSSSAEIHRHLTLTSRALRVGFVQHHVHQAPCASSHHKRTSWLHITLTFGTAPEQPNINIINQTTPFLVNSDKKFKSFEMGALERDMISILPC